VSDLNESFTLLLGRQPTDQERQDLYRVRDALKLKATDAVWLLLMALQHYETLYSKVPARIAAEVDAVTKVTRITAEKQAKAAQEEIKKGLVLAVEQAAIASRRDGARAELLRRSGWLGGGLATGGLALFLVGFLVGGAKGDASGRDRAMQECGYLATAAAWGNSADGAIARALAGVGSLRNVARCDLPGWEATRDGYCLVRPYKGKTFGWRLPATSHQSGGP
jgi:hypothetical protein